MADNPIKDALAGLVAKSINPDPIDEKTPELLDQVIRKGDVAISKEERELMLLYVKDIERLSKIVNLDPEVVTAFKDKLKSYVTVSP